MGLVVSAGVGGERPGKLDAETADMGLVVSAGVGGERPGKLDADTADAGRAPKGRASTGLRAGHAALGEVTSPPMTPEQRKEVVRLIEEGKELSAEWARVLFPPERREYELVYQGKERSEEVIAETMAVPLQPARTYGGGRKVGDEDWQNMLVFGDNLQVLKALLEKKRAGTLRSADGTEGVKLVYIDPPFATRRDFQGSQNQRAYQDKIAGAEFLEFIRKRLILIKELLADDGVLYVHTDWKKGHYLKVLLDEIFGESRFRNEIIWWYYNKMQGNISRFPSNHENIFLYSAGDTFTFNAQYLEREEGTARLLKRVWDSKRGKLVNAKDANGNVIYIETDERRLDDVWRLSMLQPADRTQNLGYPTQKPETLLALMIEATSKPGDLVMDCFAGSGTTLAVAEKLGRRWIGVDCGTLAIYTIQKRLLSLRADIGNTGEALTPKPFTLYNAGLYDFSKLKELPWEAWRFFALQLFQCRDNPHKVGGVKFDGTLKGGSVLIFNHTKNKDARVDEATIESLHRALGSGAGNKVFIVAPALTFGFQQDYIDIEDTRYYALRIPYSVIHELHQREFRALRQPSDSREVNETVDAVGFDFIKTPELKMQCGIRTAGATPEAFVRLTTFKSVATVREPLAKKANFETLSMVLLDYDYDESEQLFELDEVVFAEDMQALDWEIRFPHARLGTMMMAIFIDIYGNEARIPIPVGDFGAILGAKKATQKKART
ncbi:site-specific DNA-methyltransferase [Hyalangium rubrum]|uniref:site-specific DNA-methyltransferase (adenine-specific) n=1 Tax=Hyalangium rubrum TaxID=3103134 RepID=A0ABU5HIG9_9BACT|nr:site-specific DNA-methyltransferase [Hyalangium sp. s54d21]MDY7232679.1 site-specific DNA-methyltransferase [Hyalangium sp. s54d21]